MFKVEQRQDGKTYTISIGTGKTYRAKDMQEVVNGLQHYFQKSIAMYPFEYHKHIEHQKTCPCCPLCRD